MQHRLLIPAAYILGLFLTFSTAAAEEAAPSADEEEVVVTAARVPVLVSEAPGMVQVVTPEDLAVNPGLGDLAELLSLWLGVQVNTTGFPGGVSSLSLRGSASEQVLVMVDGVPLNNPQTGMAPLSFLSLDMIERIEIVSGPLSALYGADAMGGVVNIITGMRTGGMFSLGGNETNGNLGLSYGWNGGILSLGWRESAGDRPNSEYSGGWQFLSTRFAWDDWDISLGIYNYRDNKGVPGPNYAPSTTAREEDAETLVYLTVGQAWGDLDLKIRTYLARAETLYQDGGLAYEHEASRLGAEAQVTWKLDSALTLVGVGKWEGTGVESTSVGEHEADSGCIAAQLAWEPSENLHIYLGDLWHNHSIYSAGHSPRLSAVYSIRPDLIAKASYSQAFRAPTFNELYWPADPWSQGNPGLIPEESWTIECGLDYQYLDQLVATIAVYHTKVSQLIAWLPIEDGDGDPWNDIWTPTNHGRVHLDGLDLRVAWRPAAAWRILGQLHFLEAREFDPGTGEYSLTLANRIPVSASAAAIYTAKELQIALFTRFYGEHDGFGDAVISDFTLIWRYDDEAQLRLGAMNIADEEYSFVNGYPMPGRALHLEWRVVF